jgi:hypothetical protein
VVFEQRAPIAHLLKLGVGVFPPDLVFAEFRVALVDAPVGGLERQGGDDAGAREAETRAESGGVFWRFFGEVDLFGVWG